MVKRNYTFFGSTVNSSALCSYVTLCICYRVYVTLLYFVVYNICISDICWQIFNRGILYVLYVPMHFSVLSGLAREFTL